MAPGLKFENMETFLVYLRVSYDSQNKQRFPQAAAREFVRTMKPQCAKGLNSP